MTRPSLLLLVIILNVAGKSFAQQKYTITYENFSFYIFDSSGSPVKQNSHSKIINKLVINEHQSYFFTTQIGKNIIEHGKVLGKKFHPHTDYINTQKNIHVTQLGDKYRVKEPLKDFNWKLVSGTIMVAGYECKKAWCNYDGDSIVVLYAENLPPVFGPLEYSGLPGTILEQTRFRKDMIYRLTALTVENDALPIVEPVDGKLITWEQWKKIIANRRSDNGVIRVVRW